MVGRLGAQHIAHRVADRQQGADDLRVAGKNAVAALTSLDRDRTCFAVDDLHQPAGAVDQIRAFLDRGAISGGSRRGVRVCHRFDRVVGLGLWWRGENPGGKPVERFDHQGLKSRAVFTWPAGVGQRGTVNAALQRVLAQHHLRVLGEIAVHLDAGCGRAVDVVRFVIRRRILDLGEVDPCGASWSLSVRAALEYQHVDHHLGAGARAHAALGQTDRADQIGHAGDVFPRDSAGLVHRAGTGDEQRDPAGTQPRDRAGDEIIMQPQAQRSRDGIGPYHAIGEWRIADHEIETPLSWLRA